MDTLRPHCHIELVHRPIPLEEPFSFNRQTNGATVEFLGLVRAEESGKPIVSLSYEAYPEMALKEMFRLAEEVASRFPVNSIEVIHRVGVIPVGEAAIRVRVASPHRAEAFGFLTVFMDRLKEDVPIWKVAAADLGTAAEIAASRLCRADNVPHIQSPSKETVCQGRAGEFSPPAFSIESVHALIDSNVHPHAPLKMPVSNVGGSVSAYDVFATADVPPFSQSAVDGYAIAMPDNSATSQCEAMTFDLVESIVPGNLKQIHLKPGQAARILTGAIVPPGATHVVRQEDCKSQANNIVFFPNALLNSEKQIRAKGAIYRCGERILTAGTEITPGALALLISAGVTSVSVFATPNVTYIATGDELLEADTDFQPGKIKDSNGPMMAALLAKASIPLQRLGVSDDLAELQGAIAQFSGDLLLISGGSGPGDRDHSAEALRRSGFVIHVSRVDSRPGRPLIFATRGRQTAFGLPGNPLSQFVCHHLFVERALAKMIGKSPRRFLFARWEGEEQDPDPTDTRPKWTPGIAWLDGAILKVKPLHWRHSGDLSPLSVANTLIRGTPNICGEVQILLFGSL